MNTNNEKVITRFAPSPTGLLHLGTYRTAIFAYLYARRHDGIFILRIEDTDRERSKTEYEENIIDSLEWLGLSHDMFYRQSENVPRHTFYLEKMIKEGTAYISKEEAKDGSGVIRELVRFKNPNIDVTFHDEIKGDITTNTTDLGDFIIAKSLQEPLHHIAVVVDDFEENVTHVIRGEDLTSNTPRQILIQRAIGAPTPVYAHVPLVLGSDKLKLSKRRGALPASEYQKLGFLPEAILNGVTFVGWNPGTDQEVFTRAELIETFDLAHVQKSPAIFSAEKLEWFNREHMKRIPEEARNTEITAWLKKAGFENFPAKAYPVVFDRISKWGDILTLVEAGELQYFLEAPTPDTTMLLNGGKLKSDESKKHLEHVLEVLKNASDESFSDVEKVKALIFDYATEQGRGAVLWPLRVSLSGKDKSPDPFTLLYILGKDESISRISKAINKLS